MPDAISDWVRQLVLAGHDGLTLPWGWTLVLIGAGLHALTLALQDAVKSERHRFLAIAAWLPEAMLFLGLIIALGGELRHDICPAVNPPGIPAPKPCGDDASFPLLSDVTAPGSAAAVVLLTSALATALWALRRWIPFLSAVAALALVATLAALIATGTLPYAIGAIAVAAFVGMLRTAGGKIA
jgi:hypothetical protein